jgi:hypothetical protein
MIERARAELRGELDSLRGEINALRDANAQLEERIASGEGGRRRPRREEPET